MQTKSSKSLADEQAVAANSEELSPDELEQIQGGGPTATFVDTAINAFNHLAGPTLDGWGQDIAHWVNSFESVDTNVPYQPPIMSAEPNMSMAGGGEGYNGTPSEVTYYAGCGS